MKPLNHRCFLLSTAPVQAFETYEELHKACKASEETSNACIKTGEFIGFAAWVTLLCTLEEKGSLTREELVLNWDELVEKYGTPLFDDGLEMALEYFPECSLKP